MLRVALALIALAGPLAAADEEVVLGLSRDTVSITTNFEGSEILIYGAIKRETPIRLDPTLEVVVTVAGPDRPVTVRRKERVAGIWVNTDAVEIDSAPSFYAVATSGPLDEVLRDTEDLRHKISIPRAIRSVGAPENVTDTAAFTEALIRIRTRQGLYRTAEGGVELTEQTLFSTAIDMPANLTEGTYDTRVFLTRDGEVVGRFETFIGVRKVGLERFLFTLSREQPLAYGLLSLAIAIAAGWGASAGFRALKRG
ncbi:TIGR02186 family protein [Rhodosalinus sp.]|uniref:TIGR02186 family protein n=1 Tax=Rhodosalinus sp. TaxID=2047741 RepID=UPI00397D4EDA